MANKRTKKATKRNHGRKHDKIRLVHVSWVVTQNLPGKRRDSKCVTNQQTTRSTDWPTDWFQGAQSRVQEKNKEKGSLNLVVYRLQRMESVTFVSKVCKNCRLSLKGIYNKKAARRWLKKGICIYSGDVRVKGWIIGYGHVNGQTCEGQRTKSGGDACMHLLTCM